MNLSTVQLSKHSNHIFNKRRISEVLLELAETHLESDESRHFISEKGVEKVRKKIEGKG